MLKQSLVLSGIILTAQYDNSFAEALSHGLRNCRSELRVIEKNSEEKDAIIKGLRRDVSILLASKDTLESRLEVANEKLGKFNNQDYSALEQKLHNANRMKEEAEEKVEKLYGWYYYTIITLIMIIVNTSIISLTLTKQEVTSTLQQILMYLSMGAYLCPVFVLKDSLVGGSMLIVGLVINGLFWYLFYKEKLKFEIPLLKKEIDDLTKLLHSKTNFQSFKTEVEKAHASLAKVVSGLEPVIRDVTISSSKFTNIVSGLQTTPREDYKQLSKFRRAFIEIMWEFDRLCDYIVPILSASSDPRSKGSLAGITSTKDNLIKIMGALDCHIFYPMIGSVFNPRAQEAVGTSSCSSADEDSTISKVVCAGCSYGIYDNIVPAKVIVNKFSS